MADFPVVVHIPENSNLVAVVSGAAQAALRKGVGILVMQENMRGVVLVVAASALGELLGRDVLV